LPTIGHYFSECLKVIIRQLHEKRFTAAPSPTIALNATDQALAVVIDLDN